MTSQFQTAQAHECRKVGVGTGVTPSTSRFIEAICGVDFSDRHARSEWGWKHDFDPPAIVESCQTT